MLTTIPFEDGELDGTFKPNPDDYHHLKPEAVEWLVIMTRYLRREQASAAFLQGDVYLTPTGGDYYVFNLRKARFSAESLGLILGADPAAILATKLITLRPLDGKAEKALPKPTVPYWEMD